MVPSCFPFPFADLFIGAYPCFLSSLLFRFFGGSLVFRFLSSTSCGNSGGLPGQFLFLPPGSFLFLLPRFLCRLVCRLFGSLPARQFLFLRLCFRFCACASLGFRSQFPRFFLQALFFKGLCFGFGLQARLFSGPGPSLILCPEPLRLDTLSCLFPYRCFRGCL